MTYNKQLEATLWESAEQLWGNADLKPSEYTMPVLGLIFLKYADVKFTRIEQELSSQATSSRRTVGKADFLARRAIYLTPEARYSYLINLTDGDDVAKAVDHAMEEIEKENTDLKGVLPRGYARIDKKVLLNLLKTFNSTEMTEVEGDVFGKIYEYFLGKFHKKSGEKGGEFFTPTSLVKLIVEIIEPYHGVIYDPACGSGGMFVQSADFVARHQHNPISELSIIGQELTTSNTNLAKMNLAIHGLNGDIRTGNSYYEDPHHAVGRCDFVMANPPFNNEGADKDRMKDDRQRFPFGMPSTSNANYLWIQQFYSPLNQTGRAGYVMANSASDARNSEMAIRQKLIEAGHVDVMVAISPNFFDTVTLPCTLWFLDKGKPQDRKDNVLFLDARHHFVQVDRAHREFGEEHLQFLSDIVRMYRGKVPEYSDNALLKANFPDGKYRDVKGLCKVATATEIVAQGWSLNPGLYVGIADGEVVSDEDFKAKLRTLNDEFELLTTEANGLEETISKNVALIFTNHKE